MLFFKSSKKNEKELRITNPDDEKVYLKVRVGYQYTRMPIFNDYNSNPLTNDFRDAKIYHPKDNVGGPLSGNYHRFTITHAKKDSEKFGGQLVKVKVLVEPYKEEQS